ncbi:MAG: LPS export ABC transporter permease LptF [Candidatus Manganitrophaceae bacterium]
MLNQILDRYIFKELLVPFGFGIFILTFLILIQQLLKLMELVIDKGVDLLSVAEIFLSLLPYFFMLTIPIAVLLGSILTFNRLSHDYEIIALKSTGVGFYRLLRPVLFFSLLASLLTLLMGMIAEPWRGGSLNSMAVKILKRRSGVGIEEGKFNGTFSNVVVYVESMATFSDLEGVFIFDERDRESPKVITAMKGVLLNDPSTGTVELRLFNGSLHTKGKDQADDRRMTFASYHLKLDIGSLIQGTNIPLENLTYQEIRQRIKNSEGRDSKALRLLSEFYKKFSLSLASLAFGMVGVPLGMISGRSGRLGGVSVGIGLVILYYLLNTFGDFLVTHRVTSPFMSIWVPHAALIPFTLYLLKITAEESYPKFLRMGSKRP